MDETFTQRIVREAKERWDAGPALEAGRLIFERIPYNLWAAWGVSILELVQCLIPPSPEIQAVVELAKRPVSTNPASEDEWRAAHEIVDRVNGITVLPIIFRFHSKLATLQRVLLC